MVDIYKTDHLLWRWKVYNMILGDERGALFEINNTSRILFWVQF
jgi:hypothetical protein